MKQPDRIGITDQLRLGDVDSKLGASWRCNGKVGDRRRCGPVHLPEHEHALGRLHARGRDECGCRAHAPLSVRRVHRYSDAGKSSSRDRDAPICCLCLALAARESSGVIRHSIADGGAVGHEVHAAHVATTTTTSTSRPQSI